MRLQLDTQVFLWSQSERRRLGRSRRLLEDPATAIVVSVVSVWEIAIKYALGKLPLTDVPMRYGIESIGSARRRSRSSRRTRSRSLPCRCSTMIRSTGCWWRRQVCSGSPS